MAALGDPLDFIIGKKAADLLDDTFGIRTVDDLLRHYPRKYSRGSTVLGEDDEPPEEGEHITFVDTISQADLRRMNRTPHREYLVVTLGDRRPKVTATFFNPKYLKRTLVKGTKVMLSGEVGYFRGTMQLTHPGFLILDSPTGKAGGGTKSLMKIAESAQGDGEFDLSVFERDFFPIYPASSKLQSWDIYACVRQVLAVLDPVPDPLPESIRREMDLVSEDEALRAVHLAENQAPRERALERLRFDEAVGLQWALAQRRFGELSEAGPAAPRRDDGLRSALLLRLPFELTGGQNEVLDVISGELAQTRPMNRMLQGEVGSGKTVVALLAMLQMIDAGYQCAMLAPTEVLAEQHARSIRDVLGPLAMAGQLGGDEDATGVALLTGSMSAAAKRDAREQISSGTAGIVIGTHALLQDVVEFDRLGMVVVDEQHRFGVEQRDQLRSKAPDGVTPHLLVMTATPIPRTVALTVYGDLETSTLRELPRGRQPIATNVIFARQKPSWLDRAWQRVVEEVAAGRQAYVVAPRIEDDDKMAKPVAGSGRTATAVVDLYAKLSKGPLAGVRVGLMHGRLTPEEKDAVMGGFRAGEIDVLVCTTVIEVGVDVPNATVMVVIDADWFGISQLHQLRGRIGRGSHPSLCLLVTDLSEASKAGGRLRAVASTLDGFELADLDLEERREGDVLGRRQSGRASGLRLLSLIDHRPLIETAREFCDEMYPRDPDNRGMALLAAPFSGTDRIEYMDKS
ncbi:ATP-dependent DNA helicase RecG [Mycolicibacterium chitae]|uniref:ATP-dependent DNA helicase RecG n=1 Tax=Mycolicibacterium chitae TaxID=1792 RepID=A0A3S4RTY1_MYCCI|nr:ATP-dependent DNA helicase RecG [Mycolicibacterium chitae]MCV7108842.1 ATP-dependent DNA helicase RecG [Mycolicibacterium chitae]BBZ05135.1 ATP-dependent DNA helicase RecG [Mycolicibacterium chitae]VEG48756.1 ATP-dependent DNA helicase RecG [Mycolicibacterium chitae]